MKPKLLFIGILVHDDPVIIQVKLNDTSYSIFLLFIKAWLQSWFLFLKSYIFYSYYIWILEWRSLEGSWYRSGFGHHGVENGNLLSDYRVNHGILSRLRCPAVIRLAQAFALFICIYLRILCVSYYLVAFCHFRASKVKGTTTNSPTASINNPKLTGNCSRVTSTWMYAVAHWKLLQFQF